MADKAGIAAVLNASSIANTGTQITTPDRVGRWLRWFKRRAESDTRLVTTANGAIIGYTHVVNEAPHLIVTVKGAVHPDYRGRGIGAYLLRWAEQRAVETIPLAPAAPTIFTRKPVSPFSGRKTSTKKKYGRGKIG